MTPLPQFYDMLAAHDWFYAFSDSPEVNRRGERSVATLNALAKESPEHAALLQAFESHTFSGSSFGCPEVPLPPRPSDQLEMIPSTIDGPSPHVELLKLADKLCSRGIQKPH